MQRMIRRLDEKKMISNPYLQPFQPNAFFQWAPTSMQAADVNHDISKQSYPIEPLAQVLSETSVPIANMSEQPKEKNVHMSIGGIGEQTDHFPYGMQLPVAEVPLNPVQPQGTNPQNPNHHFTFTNHPLFPPYPMNEQQWQQYQGNPRPPLNPYPTNPYPSVSKATKQSKATAQNPLSNFMTHFKTVEGGYDFPKMMNTAGSMLNSVNQISSIAKSIGGLFISGK